MFFIYYYQPPQAGHQWFHRFIQWLLFFHDPRTWTMAVSCSRTCSFIVCLEPHPVGDSVIIWWVSRRVQLVLHLFFLCQLKEKALTTFWQTRMTCSILGPPHNSLHEQKVIKSFFIHTWTHTQCTGIECVLYMMYVGVMHMHFVKIHMYLK